MSFAEQYKAHAYHDLIAEAEKQGIGLGVERERERIIKLLKDYWCGEAPCDKHPVRMDWIIAAIQLKQGETDGEVNDDLVSKSEM